MLAASSATSRRRRCSGRGCTNMLTPTSDVLGIARIPYGTWLKWAWRFILALILLGFLLMLPTLWLNLPGF